MLLVVLLHSHSRRVSMYISIEKCRGQMLPKPDNELEWAGQGELTKGAKWRGEHGLGYMLQVWIARIMQYCAYLYQRER